VLAVVFYHFAPDVLPGGFLGVDLFFVLSGFLITSLLIKEWDATRAISLTTFWVRRARRLLPALVLVLAVVGLYGLVFPDPVDGRRFAVDGLFSLGYVANWHFVASGQAYIDQFLNQSVSPLRHMWSLAIEEQFYLVWPLLVLGVTKLTGRRITGPSQARERRFRGALLALCAVLGVASFVRMITLYDGGSGDLNRVYYGTDSRVFVILIGAVLAVLTFGAPTIARRLRSTAVVAGCIGAIALLVAAASFTAESPWLYEGGYGLVAIVMALVLLAACQPGGNPLSRLLGTRALVGLGLISYGVYLWHWPISLWITADGTGLGEPWLFLARAAVTLAASLASYVLVERPIRTGTLRFGFSRGTLAATGVVAALLVVLIVPVTAFPSVRTAPTTAAKRTEVVGVNASYEGAARCDGGPEPTRVDPDRQLLIQLEGNSLAGEIRTCLAKIMQPRGVRFEKVDPPDFLLCDVLPDIAEQVQRTRPDAGLLFAFVTYETRCGEPWHRPVDDLVRIWRDAGMHVYLVPSPPFIEGTAQAQEFRTGPQREALHYRALAALDPEHITVLDAGTFVRTDAGEYVWRMPCLADGEPGCGEDGTVGVRYVDGLHFCTDPEFAGRGCVGAEHMGGQRRAAAALAQGLIASLEARVAADGQRVAPGRATGE
jgi:peptidoglycan/LPS O-acetylase OafA/YrhL